MSRFLPPVLKRFFLVSSRAIWLLSLLLLGGCGQSDDQVDISERVDEASQDLLVYNFSGAYGLLKDVQPKLSTSNPYWEEATYAFALACWQKQPPDAELVGLAVNLFESLIENSNSPELVAQAKINLGRIYEVSDFPGDEKNVERARGYYNEVLQNAPTMAYAYKAILRLAQTYEEQLDQAGMDEAIRLTHEAVDTFPASPWKGVAAQYLGDLYVNKDKDYANALKAYQVAREYGFPRRSKEDVYIWRMAEFAERSGQERLAMDYYMEILTDYPRSVYGTRARDRIVNYVESHPQSDLDIPESVENHIEGQG